MADLYADNLAGVYDGAVPVKQPDGSRHHAKLYTMSAVITLASQGTSDNIMLGKLPPGAVFSKGVITASATLGASAQVAIGLNKTHGSNGDYRSAATFTSADTPTLFGKAAAKAATPLAAETPVYLTIGVAALPSSGTLVVDIEYSRR
jgi:hypothetical protein